MSVMICILAAMGAASLLWCLAGLLLFPVTDRDGFAVWHIGGDCPQLEHRLRLYGWLRETGFVGSDVVLIDHGMDEEAKRAAACCPWVRILPIEKAEQWMSEVVDEWNRSLRSSKE